MAELAGDFGKLRLPLPKNFSGDPSDWEEWEWNFKSYLAIFQPDVVDFLVRAETSDVEIVDAHFATALQQEEAVEMRMFSRKLHYLLANLCTGSARLLVRQNAAGNGFETWRRLSQRFSLPDATRHVSLLTKILEWKFNTQTFEQDFNAWETVKAKYEQQTGTPIPDSVLVATLMNKTSGALQQHLRLNAATINTYEQMRNTLVQYFRSRHILTSSDSGLAPMDVGALKGKGYFKGKSKGKGKGFGHWNFMKGKGGKSKGKGKGKDFKGNKGKGIGKTSHKGKGKGVVCFTCWKPGHTSRECALNRVNAVEETSWTDTPWTDNWTENETSNLGETNTGENEETSWHDNWYVGHVNFDDWWYDDWDWTSWDDDWSWDHTWSSWNEPTSSSPPTLQESQNNTSVTVTELPSSSTSGSGAKVSAVTSGPPPGIERTSSPRGNTSRSKSLLMAAITLGTFGVGNSVLVGPVLTPTCEISGNSSCNFETLETVGLKHVNLPDFEDRFIDQHLTVAPTVDTSWILFDSGAAANCCPKNFAPEWPLLPITGTKPPLRSVTGQPLKIYGRKLVGMRSGDCAFYLHFYVTDIEYPLVSVGRLLNQGYQVELSSDEMTLKSPCGSKIPLHRHGSLLFMKPSLQVFDSVDFESVCVTFHEKFKPKNVESTSNEKTPKDLVAPTSGFKPIYYHADRWYFDTSRNVLIRYHKRQRKNLFTPEGTSDRPVELDKIAPLRKTFVTFEDKSEQVIEDDWRTSDDPKRALDKFWKGRTEFTLISAPTGRRLEGKQSTLPVVQDLSKTKSSRVTSTSADQKPTSDSAMFESHPVNPSRQLLEELAVAGDNIDQVKEILLRYWEQPDPTTGLPYTHDFWLKCPLFWLRFHYEPRTTLFTPRELDLIGGPSLEDLGSQRMTLCVTSVGNIWKHDTWTVDTLEVFEPFTGLTLFDLSEKDVYDPPPLPEVDMDTSAQAPRSLHVPKEPTAQERAEHELTHLPFRSWCKTCVMSKSRQDHSKKLRLKQPVLQCDYSFFTDPKVEGSVTILNVRDVMSGLALACVVPNKGRSVYAEGELRRFILETGRTFGVLQADPETSLVALAETVTSELGGLSLRKSPTEWKQAQGAVGNSQQLLYAQVRTLRQDLADRYGTLVPITSSVFTWLLKHAQFLLNNFAIRSDGLTPFERRWSKRYTSALCKFGEIVLCRLRGKQPKADPSWVPGLWLGRDTSADMHVVGTTSGVFKTRSIRRLPVSEQVDKQLLKDFQAKPWDPKGRGEDTDVLVLPQAPEAQGLPPLPVQQTDGTSAVDSSQHGLKRTSEELGGEAQEVEPPNLFQRVGPAQSDLKRSAPDSVPGSETKLQRISAVFEDDSLPVVCACVASISTKSGLDVPIEPNVDREEELQALRAAEPVIWYDTEFDREQEIAGMNKEMTSIKDFDVYEEKLITECTSEQLENAISTKWVKRAKGDGVKCRVCVRGYDQEVDPDDTYASTPSLITLKLLLTLAVAHGWHILAGDVSTAFLHALLTDEVFVIPPVEYYPNGGVLWKLRKAMYGLKQSPRMWQQHFASVAASLGFERLKSDSNLYFHPERRCYMLCYVDDLLIFGDKKTTEFLFSELQKQLCLRSEGVLEPGTSISFLGRCITRREDSIEMSMPTSYIDKMLEQLDMLKCRHAATPGTDALRKLIDSEELLSPEDHRLYRRIVGQLLWLSSIRPDIQFAVKELSRGLTSPTEDHRTKMKTLLRYLAGTKPMVLTLRPKIIPHSKQTTFDIDTYVDSDWAGCATSRRSTSGMALYFLGTLITSQSRTQATVALSSGEAELYAIGLGVSESLFIRSLLLESQLSKNVNIRIHTDSTAGKSMATRFGTSKKTKHVQLRFLFIQELVASGVVSIKKVSGTSNPSDVMTKYITKEVLHRHLMALGITYPFGRVGWLRTACVQTLSFTLHTYARTFPQHSP